MGLQCDNIKNINIQKYAMDGCNVNKRNIYLIYFNVI